MASYQARQRDPLLDQGTQAMLERRGRELFGAGLVVLGFCLAMMLWSYSPNDPSWMVAPDGPIANSFGHFGASLASTMILLAGKGAWVVPLIVSAWGMRFVLHRGAERVLTRAVFLPIAAAAASVYGATLTAGADWTHYFGLGGLFGDTALGVLVNLLPISPEYGIKTMSLAFGVIALLVSFLVAGFTRAELAEMIRFLVTGVIVTYNYAMGAAHKGAVGSMRAGARLQERRRAGALGAQALSAPTSFAAAQRAGLVRRPEADPTSQSAAIQPDTRAEWGHAKPLRADARYSEPLAEAAQYAAPREKTGFLSLMPQALRRVVAPEPELVEAHLSDEAMLLSDFPNDDRIKSRISDVIRQRSRNPILATNATNGAPRYEPGLGRPRGPTPLIADTSRRTEPPISAATQAAASLSAAAQSLSPGGTSPGFTSRRAIGDGPKFGGDVDRAADLAIASDWDASFDDSFEGDEDFTPGPDLRARIPVMDARRPVVQAPQRKAALPSRQAMAESQPRLRFEDKAPAYELPPLSLLSSPSAVERHSLSNDALEENARMLESVLDDYGVRGEITSVRPGPVVTMYELEPAPGLKASRVIGLSDDIARSMSALSARVSTVPGRTVIGIELPNAVREKVVLREIISARDFGDSSMRLPLALGKDIGGEPIIANLAKMPHLLIAGTTGSGKSVAINTMILSLLYKLSPEECRLIMIDPKMLELSVYDGIPHLLSPVVTDPKKAVVALKWVVGEMEERYRKMSKTGVRNIEGYNGRVREALAKNEMFKRTIQTGFDEDTGEPVFETEEVQPVVLPYIVVVVDEMADLMMVAGKEIEACIQRLAQMARASGIHLIMATQRPSVDVITGTIKANFPTRISFQVTSKIDSRTILGEQGAEQLLGMGDMLYMAGGGRVSRIHGPFVSDEEVEEIVNHLKSYGAPVYMSGVIEGPEDDAASDIDMVLGLGGDGSDDALYDQAVAIVAKDRKCSTSYIQRKLGIGYNKAAKLVEQMEDEGVVTPANHVGKREILVPER
jgi:S-DNA-T family DNA segregation ATPase FtsK/SpoIIIE